MSEKRARGDNPTAPWPFGKANELDIASDCENDEEGLLLSIGTWFEGSESGERCRLGSLCKEPSNGGNGQQEGDRQRYLKLEACLRFC